MHLVPCHSHRIRGHSAKFDPIAQLRRRWKVLSDFSGTLGASHSNSKISSSVCSNPSIQTTRPPPPPPHAMVSNPIGSTLLGSMYSGYKPVTSANDPTKVIKKYGLFRFEEYANDTPWHVPSPLNLAPSRHPLPNFMDYFPKFSRNGTCTIEDHLNAFLNA